MKGPQGVPLRTSGTKKVSVPFSRIAGINRPLSNVAEQRKAAGNIALEILQNEANLSKIELKTRDFLEFRKRVDEHELHELIRLGHLTQQLLANATNDLNSLKVYKRKQRGELEKRVYGLNIIKNQIRKAIKEKKKGLNIDKTMEDLDEKDMILRKMIDGVLSDLVRDPQYIGRS